MFLGIALALATSVTWALGNVFIQRTGRVLGGPRAMLWAMLVGGAMAALASWGFDRRTAPVTPAVLAWMAVAGGAGLVAYAGLFYSFSRAKLSLAVPFVSCWALVAAVMSVAVFGERPRPQQLLGAAVVFVGVLLVARGATRDTPGEGAPGGRRPLLAALAAGLAFGVMLPSMGRATAAVGAFGATAVVYGVGVLLAWPLGRLAGLDLRPPPRAAWGLILATGVFETSGYVTLTLGGRFAPMALLAPIASLGAALTVLAAWLFLRERPPRLALVGALLASAGIVLLAR